jgi:DNA-binding NarL/FixJ family response regulator
MLVVAGPGSLQDGLLAMITTISQVQAVLVAEEPQRVLKMIADHRPPLVLLDMALLGEEARTVLRQINAGWPSTRCIALADDVQQEREAEAAGAHAVLIKGYPVVRLVDTIERLLSEREGENTSAG